MKLLITGANGQLGQDLQHECARHGIDALPTGLDQIDIRDRSAVHDAVSSYRPTAIVNCAAYNAVDRAETEFEAACRVNSEGPRNLAAVAEQAGVVLMHFGTDFVFDGEKGAPYGVDDPPHPLSAYGRSKLLGEEHVRASCARHYIVRLSWVFGRGNINFPRKVLQWAKERSAIDVVTDQISGPAYTADLAPAILDLLGTGAFGLYHLSNRGYCSRFEWAQTVLEAAGAKLEVRPVLSSAFPSEAARPAFSALESSRISGVIGRELPGWRDATRRFLAEIGANG